MMSDAYINKPRRHYVEWPQPCPYCGSTVIVRTYCQQTTESATADDGDPWSCDSGHEGVVDMDCNDLPTILRETYR